AQVDAGAMHALAEHDALARVAQAVYGLAFYIRKTLVPSGLGPMYELPPRAVLLGPMSWISAVAVAAVAVFAVRRRRRVPALAAALAAYAIMVAPVLGFVQSGRQLVADRYSYVSCLGFAVVAAAGVLTYLSRPAQRADRRRRAVVGLVACVVVAGLSRATLWQTEFWDNPVTLWHRGVQVSPDSAIAHVNYADALATTGHPRAMRLSVKHYRRGLELDPTDDIALAHLARLLAFTGETTAAIGAYRRALVLNPDRRGTPLALARLLVRRHGPQDIRWALLALRDTLERHPDDIDAMLYLAELLATAGDAALRDGGEAVRWATHASEARGGNDPSALRTLATAYAEARRFDDAVETAEKALRLARLAGAPPLAADIDRRITLFRQEKPYHAE
ncbi:MAG: hypothetical protein ACE5E6_02605, partial [Phycisphaerae bacterium]